MVVWRLSHRGDPEGKRIADRHYNRQNPDAAQFVPPGRCIVLLSPVHERASALWVTSWPFAEFVKHAWAGAWVNSCFRNEGAGLSSDLIRAAVAATCAVWDPPPLGLVTFVDASKVRHKRDPGRCYVRAGFRHVGETKGGLLAFQLPRAAMPEPQPAYNGALALFGGYAALAPKEASECAHTFEANPGMYDTMRRYCTKCGVFE